MWNTKVKTALDFEDRRSFDQRGNGDGRDSNVHTLQPAEHNSDECGDARGGIGLVTSLSFSPLDAVHMRSTPDVRTGEYFNFFRRRVSRERFACNFVLVFVFHAVCVKRRR
jgi:hypothetical protein